MMKIYLASNRWISGVFLKEIFVADMFEGKIKMKVYNKNRTQINEKVKDKPRVFVKTLLQLGRGSERRRK